MARVEKTFRKTYFLEMESIVRGHHIYKTVWSPRFGEKLFCRHDEREEAKIFDYYAFSISKTNDEEENLVGHIPIEFSFLFLKFIEREENNIVAEVREGRKLENGLVVPARYYVCGRKRKFVEIFLEEMKKLQDGKAAHMGIKVSEINACFRNEL